jgi:16S rRNA (guanine527-N7)-methyltransferase
MLLTEFARYEALGLSEEMVDRLSRFGDLLMSSPINVTALRSPQQIESGHFVDSLSLLGVPAIRSAGSIVDVGSGGGLPAVVLAAVLPSTRVVALESVRKKCDFISHSSAELGLANFQVCCARAEEYAAPGAAGREAFDVAVARAVAALPILAELCLPLVKVGGRFIAMKGDISNQERMEGETAAAILGGGEVSLLPVEAFEGGGRRCLVVVPKRSSTPAGFPRRPGLPAKRPLGLTAQSRGKGTER